MARRSDNGNTWGHADLPSGTMVAQYRVSNLIGRGGMGEVYLAEDTILKRSVALKLLQARSATSPDLKARFRREAMAVATLSHQNIVTVFEVGEFQDRPFLAMEHVSGESLRAILRRKELPLTEALDFICQICDGLQEAHSGGVVHRDLKPGNIMADERGRLRILDFGLAMMAGDRKLTKPGTTMGTVGYISPEQIKDARVDQRSDVFSVGVMLYEVVTGRRPFAGENDAAVIRAIESVTPEPLARYKSDLPLGLQQVVDKALDKNPRTRYQHADELRVDLSRIMAGMEAGAPPSSHSVQIVKRTSPRKLIIGAVVILLVALVSFMIGWDRQAFEMKDSHLAVLPFTNLGSTPKSQMFCDGLVEILSSKVTQMEQFQGSLYVVPASELRQYGVASARQARRMFGATHAVTGSVRLQGQELRLTLNLVDARTERQLRSAVVDEHMDAVVSLQDSLLGELARMLQFQLHVDDRRLLAAGETDSPAAYEWYITALGYMTSFDREAEETGLDSARRMFERAIQHDPDYALAHAGLGEAYWRKYVASLDTQWVAPALKFSNSALGLAEQSAPVMITLGLVQLGSGRYQDAATSFQRALATDSLNTTAYRELARTYEQIGRLPEAESIYLKSIEVRPHRWWANYDLALFYLYQGRNEEALTQLELAENKAPDAVHPLNNLGALYLYLGLTDEAEVMLKRSVDLAPSRAAYSNLGTISTLEEDPKAASIWYELALEEDARDYRLWINLAGAYEAAGQDTARTSHAYRRAIALAEAVREVNPSDPLLLCHLADCYLSQGEAERALELIRRANEIGKGNVEVLVRSGMTLEEAGQRMAALAAIAEAIQKGYPRDQIAKVPELRDLLSDSRLDSLVALE